MKDFLKPAGRTLTLLTMLAMGAASAWGDGTPGVSAEKGGACTFSDGVRYSQLVINSRINDFKANTTDAGFGIFSADGTMVTDPKNSKSELDYVPGLVAKAIIEAVDYYKGSDAVDVKPWFYAIQYYANKYDITSNGKNGKSFDDLNAVKLYFCLKSLAADGAFADGQTISGVSNTNSSTVSTADSRLAAALTGIKKANDNYAISASTLEGAAGGWFHKSSYTDQMWCDGQYMGPALLAQMLTEQPANTVTGTAEGDWAMVTRQFTISWNYLWDEDARLLYHAFTADPAGSTAAYWAGVSATAGSEVYHSAEFWGRAEGWYFLALVDVLEQMQLAGLAQSANYATLSAMLQKLAAGIAARQDATTGCWYQLLAHDGSFQATAYNSPSGKSSYRYTDEPVNNYLESSATAIFTATYLKGMRLGLFDTDYTAIAKKAYQGIINKFMVGDGNGGVHLIACCKSAGLGGSNYRDGSAAYYLMGKDTKPTSANPSSSDFYTEGKVFGAFVLAATEYERLFIDGSMGISATTADRKANSNSYDLQGRPASSKTRPFVGIRNGKKVIVK